MGVEMCFGTTHAGISLEIGVTRRQSLTQVSERLIKDITSRRHHIFSEKAQGVNLRNRVTRRSTRRADAAVLVGVRALAAVQPESLREREHSDSSRQPKGPPDLDFRRQECCVAQPRRLLRFRWL